MSSPNNLSSQTNEWNTPAEYVEAARLVLGVIDLDPASTPQANKVVRALQFYDEQSEGLSHPWRGRVFMNPPWGRIGPKFIGRLLEEFETGRVTAAILLCASRTETRWFQPLFDYTICFPNHRIAYGRAEPVVATAIVYLGPEILRFTQVFSHYGPIVRRLRSGELFCCVNDKQGNIAPDRKWSPP